jgi:hypothetical protein
MYRIPKFPIAILAAALLPIHARAADRHQSYDELAASADKIVLGSVALRQSYWGDDSRIYTDVVLSTEVGIKGTEDGAVVVRIQGGTVGDTTMSVSDGPELNEGERVLVFLRREADHFTVVGRGAGSVRASSAEAPLALESAFANAERLAGGRLRSKRGLAGTYLERSAAGLGGGQQAAAQVGCYSADSVKWGASSATYKIAASIPGGWAPSIDASAATWSNAGAAFRLVSDPASNNEISYVDLVAKYGASYTNTLAVTSTWSSRSTGQISRAMIEINTKWPWSTSGAASGPDVQNIVTHEFGHWMRLLDIYGPTTCSEVTMWGSAPFGETKKRTLEQADIDGLLSLYGAASGSAAGGGSAPAGGAPSGGSGAVGMPTLVSPANGTFEVSAAPVLTWNAVPNATSYDIYFGTVESPGLVATVSSTSYPLNGLAANTVYYWRIVAKNATSSESSWLSYFKTGSAAGTGATPASTLTLITPANGATGVPTTTTMQWSSVAGATSYDVYIGVTPSPGLAGSIGATIARVSGFRAGTLYYWKVVAQTPSGPVSSAVWSFRTN